MHNCEEVPDPSFADWTVHSFDPKNSEKEMKPLSQFDRIYHIYGAILSIGSEIAQMVENGQSAHAVANHLK